MSTDSFSKSEQAGLPQPVKKRGRFANLGENVGASSLEESDGFQRGQEGPVPEGFVRYELDEEDSEDDPDFEAGVEAAEDEEDDHYEYLEDITAEELVPDNARRSEAQLNRILTEPGAETTPRRRSNIHHQALQSGRLTRPRDRDDDLSTPTAPFRGTYEDADDPDFEVDNLDSTDDEDELEDSEAGREGDQRDGEGGLGSGRNFLEEQEHEEVEVDELDEAESDDDDDDIDVDDDEEDDEDADEGNGLDEYQQFLMGLLADTGEAEGGPDGLTGGLPPPSWAPDDDDDFDYLRESARVRDDPLEYRDDLQVSRKELVQLFSNTTAGSLRRQTRNSRVTQTGRARNPSALTPAPPPTASVSQTLANGRVAAPTPIIPSVQPSSTQPGPTRDSLPSSIAPLHATFMSLPLHLLHQFREQLAVHVQILTTVHAEITKASRTLAEVSVSAHESHDVRSIRDASNRSEILLRGLMENKKVSMLYHQAMGTNLSRLKGFSERLLRRDRNDPFKYESCKFSVYNLPVLDLLEAFMNDCRTAELLNIPDGVLEPFKDFHRADITQALRTRPQGRQYSTSGSRPGWFPWTGSDDRLLAMTLAKYGSDDIGQFSKDLLPHRQEEDCQTRVRYLSSRRCPDNPVKRQMMFITSPLNKEEVELVRRGLYRFGQGNTDDPSVWKRIQAELLPGREWSHVQKLWNWRETRRKYKAKYRSKSYKEKKAKEGTAPT